MSEPVNPSTAGSLDLEYCGQKVRISGNYAYVIDGSILRIINVSDPENPAVIGSFDPRVLPPPNDIEVVGNYAYLTGTIDSISVVDITDPANPFLSHTLDIPGTASDIEVAGSYAYLSLAFSDSYEQLVILDIAEPSSPFITATVIGPSAYCGATDVAVSGEYAYFTTGYITPSCGLYVVGLCPGPPGSPEIALDPTSLSFVCDQGSNPPNQSFHVWNSGDGVLSYFVSDDSNWILNKPSSGGSAGESDMIEVKCNAYRLPAGAHTGKIVIADPNAANNPQRIEVTLTVNPVFHELSAFASPPEGGTVTGAGTYGYGELASVEALPAAGWKFDHWEGDDIDGSTANPAQLTMDADKSVTATFVPDVLTRINLVSPPDGATLTSPPTFAWAADGGTSNAYAVDLAFAPDGPFYSTYENLHRLIFETSWAMPAALWDRIPRGKRLYWRVRGTDISQAPATIVTSEEVWSFYK